MRPHQRLFLILFLAFFFIPLLTVEASAAFWSSYPPDGKFKQLPARADM